MIKKPMFVGLFGILILITAISSFFAGSYITNLDSDGIGQLDLNNAISKLESQTESNPIVAVINDQEIRLDEVNDIISASILQGQQLDSVTALDAIITKTLLLEEAQNRDITTSISDAEKEMTSMYIQNGLSREQFEKQLEQFGTTYDQTLEIFREELIINKMLADEISNVEIQVSDNEVKIFFEENIDMIKAQIGNSTGFDDVSSQLKTNLLQQKQQKVALDFIEDLESKAVIITYQDKLQ